MGSFMMCFIPLFVAIDPLGVIPIYLSLTEGMAPRQMKRVIGLTMLTAVIFAVAFLMLGKGIFTFLGISVHDFKIAGGIILLLIALDMVLSGKEREEKLDHAVGIVPLGVPLIVGPASITTLLIQVDSHELPWVIASLVANLGLVALVFIYSRYIARALGTGGMTALSKIVGLFLAAIAVMMMRVGIQGAFKL
ncbi:MAG: MarC family protein [Pseudomonadota bacterium]